ncbi:hypothetical protein Scep_024323 [Stephania cephalantha]|uniref:Uncharacterized protein n=1 Tax=Stephania cephalantha TaxID=152367 RepID=A0AAP0F1T6_9MAGN
MAIHDLLFGDNWNTLRNGVKKEEYEGFDRVKKVRKKSSANQGRTGNYSQRFLSDFAFYRNCYPDRLNIEAIFQGFS